MKRIILVLLCFLIFPTQALAYSRSQHKSIATIKKVAHEKGYGPVQTKALLKLAYRESRYHRFSVTGHCKGLFQIWTYVGKRKWASARWSTGRAIRYIRHRYGRPTDALAHSYRYTWY